MRSVESRSQEAANAKFPMAFTESDLAIVLPGDSANEETLQALFIPIEFIGPPRQNFMDDPLTLNLELFQDNGQAYFESEGIRLFSPFVKLVFYSLREVDLFCHAIGAKTETEPAQQQHSSRRKQKTASPRHRTATEVVDMVATSDPYSEGFVTSKMSVQALVDFSTTTGTGSRTNSEPVRSDPADNKDLVRTARLVLDDSASSSERSESHSAEKPVTGFVQQEFQHHSPKKRDGASELDDNARERDGALKTPKQRIVSKSRVVGPKSVKLQSKTSNSAQEPSKNHSRAGERAKKRKATDWDEGLRLSDNEVSATKKSKSTARAKLGTAPSAQRASKTSAKQQQSSSKLMKREPLTAKAASQSNSKAGETRSKKSASSRKPRVTPKTKRQAAMERHESFENERGNGFLQKPEKRSTVASRLEPSRRPFSAEAWSKSRATINNEVETQADQHNPEARNPQRSGSRTPPGRPLDDKRRQVLKRKTGDVEVLEEIQHTSADSMQVDTNFDELVRPSDTTSKHASDIKEQKSFQVDEDRVEGSFGLSHKDRKSLLKQSNQSFGSKLNQALVQFPSLVLEEALNIPKPKSTISSNAAPISDERDSIIHTTSTKNIDSLHRSQRDGNFKMDIATRESSKEDVPSVSIPSGKSAEKIAGESAPIEADSRTPTKEHRAASIRGGNAKPVTGNAVLGDDLSQSDSSRDVMLEDDAILNTNDIAMMEPSKTRSSPADDIHGQDETDTFLSGVETSRRWPLMTYIDEQETKRTTSPCLHPAAPAEESPAKSAAHNPIAKNESPLKSSLRQSPSKDSALDTRGLVIGRSNMSTTADSLDRPFGIDLDSANTPLDTAPDGHSFFNTEITQEISPQADALAQEPQATKDALQKDDSRNRTSQMPADRVEHSGTGHKLHSPVNTKNAISTITVDIPRPEAASNTRVGHTDDAQPATPVQKTSITDQQLSQPIVHTYSSSQHTSLVPLVKERAGNNDASLRFTDPSELTPFQAVEISSNESSTHKTPSAEGIAATSDRQARTYPQEHLVQSVPTSKEAASAKPEITSKGVQTDDNGVHDTRLPFEPTETPEGKNAVAENANDSRDQPLLPPRASPTPPPKNVEASLDTLQRRPSSYSWDSEATSRDKFAKAALAASNKRSLAPAPITPAHNHSTPRPPPSPAPHKTPIRNIREPDHPAETSSLPHSRPLSTPSRLARPDIKISKWKPTKFSERLRAETVALATPQITALIYLPRSDQATGRRDEAETKDTYARGGNKKRENTTKRSRPSPDAIDPTDSAIRRTDADLRPDEVVQPRHPDKIKPLRAQVRFAASPRVDLTGPRRGILNMTTQRIPFEKDRKASSGDHEPRGSGAETIQRVKPLVGTTINVPPRMAELRKRTRSASQERPKTANADKRLNKSNSGDFFKRMIEDEVNQRLSKEDNRYLRSPFHETTSMEFDTTLVDDGSVFEDDNREHTVRRRYADETGPNTDKFSTSSSSSSSSSSGDEKGKCVRSNRKTWNDARHDPRRPYADLLFDVVDELCYKLARAEDGVKIKVKELERGGHWVLQMLAAAVSRYGDSEEASFEPRRRRLLEACEAVLEAIRQDEEELRQFEGLDELHRGMQETDEELLGRLAELRQDVVRGV